MKEEIQETQKNHVEGKVEEYESNEHKIQKSKNQTVDGLDRLSEIGALQTHVSHTSKNSQDGCETASTTDTEMESFQHVTFHQTMNANAAKPTESSEGEILNIVPSFTQISPWRTSKNIDADLQEQSIVEKQKDITDTRMEDQVNKHADEITRIYEHSDKIKTNHDAIPLTQDTENRKAVESSQLSIECQDLEPTTATENNKEEIPKEKLIANNIPSDENVTEESDGKEHPKDGMTNSQMVIKDEQSETKHTENENSVVNIISLYSTTGSNEKILEDNQVTSFVSESLVKNNSNIETGVETTESEMEQKTRKPDYASSSSDETNGNNQVTNGSPFTGISEERTYQKDYEAAHQIVKDHTLESRKTENMAKEKDHDSTSMEKDGDEDVVYDAQITHTEDMIEQNTEETFHDEGKKLQQLEKVEAKYFHSDQSSMIHEQKEIEITSTKREEFSSEKFASSSVSEHLLTEIDTQDESRNRAEKDATSYTNKLSFKIGKSIDQIDEKISSGGHLNETHTSKGNKEENHKCEISTMEEERRQETNKKSEDTRDLDVGSEMLSTSKNEEEERAPALAAIELSVPRSMETSTQATEERNEALNNQVLEDHGQENKSAEENCTLETTVNLSLGENLDTKGSNYQKKNTDRKEMLDGFRHLDSPVEKDSNDLEINRQIEITCQDVKDDAGSIHAEVVHTNNEEHYDEEKLKVNADCSLGDQGSKPDDLTKEENIQIEDFEKLSNETITDSSITEKVLDESKQDDDGDVAFKVGSSDSDKTVEETGVRDGDDEISKEVCFVDSQNLVVKNVESQDTNIKLLDTRESAEKPRNILKESQSHSPGMDFQSISAVRDHVKNVEEKEEICVPPSVEFSIQQTQKDNQVVTEQISEDHTFEKESEEVETTVTALEFSNKDHDVMASCREEDRKENSSDDREVDLFQQTNASQEKKIDSSSKRTYGNVDDEIGSACIEQSSLITSDETFHDEGKEPHSLEEKNAGSMHANTHDRVDDHTSKAENSFASSDKFLPETVETLSSNLDLLKERAHVQDLKTFEKDENSNYGKLEGVPHYRDSGYKEISDGELLIKEAKTLNNKNDESHIMTTDLPITHEATGVGNNTQETLSRNLDSNQGQNHESLDNLQASVWETSNKKGDSSTLLSDKDARDEVSIKETVECICEEENDNDANNKDTAGLQQKDVPKSVVLQANQENDASTRAIIEINETNFIIQDEGFEMQNDKRPETNITDIIAEDKDPDSLSRKEKGHSLSTSELIEAREKIITEDRLEEEDTAKKPFQHKENMSEADQTNAPNIEDEEDTSHGQNDKEKTENLLPENLSTPNSDMPVVHALLARALDISDQDGTADATCARMNEINDTEEHSVSGDDEKDSEYENTLKSDNETDTLIHKKDLKGKYNPPEDSEPNKEVSIMTDLDATKEAQTWKEKIISEMSEKCTYEVNEGSRNAVSEECGKTSERDSFGSSVKKTTHDNKNPERAFKWESRTCMDSSSSEMIAKTLKFENAITQNVKDEADGEDINNEKKKIEFEGNVKEEVNEKTAPEQNKLLEGYNAKATNDHKEEDEMSISNIEHNIKKTTEMKLYKAEESRNIDKSTQTATEVEELKISVEKSINVSEVEQIKDDSISSNTMDTDKDQSAELPEENALRNECEKNNDSKSENEESTNSLHRNNVSDKPSDVKVIEKIKKQINAAQIQNPEMLETANFAREQISNEENFTMVDSREKEENKESKNEEKKITSTTILSSAMQTVTVDAPKEHENTEKPSISETVNIVRQDKERIIESDDIAMEEPLDIGPSINVKTSDEANCDALHPSKEIDAAGSAKEQEENTNCFALKNTKVASEELEKSSSSVAPNESSLLQDKVVQETEKDAGNFVAISNKESLDSMDPFDRIESKELKDQQKHVFAPHKDTNMIIVVDQLEEIRNSDTSEVNMGEEINKNHNATYNKSSKKERLDAEVSFHIKENREQDIKAEPVIHEATKESHFPKVEESHFMQMMHDFDIVSTSKMTKARVSTEEETNKGPNTSAVTEAPLEKTFKPGETPEKIAHTINSIKTIEEHIRNENFHFNTLEKDDTQDTSFSIGKKEFIDKDVGSNLVPTQHSLDGLHPDRFEINVSNEEANKCINASSISKDHTGENEKHSNIIPIEHENEVMDSKETIEKSESSVILASQQIITKGSNQDDKEAVSLEKERKHEVEQFDNSNEVDQQVPNDLPVSQFLLNQIMGGKLLCETDDFKLKTELNEESPDIEQNKDAISRQEDDETDNHIKHGTRTNTADENVKGKEPADKSNLVPVDKSHDENETTEDEDEDKENTQRLGICGSFDKIGTDEEMISQLSEETNHEALNSKTKQSLQMVSASEINEDVSPSKKIQVEVTTQEAPHCSTNLRKNLEASFVIIEHDVGQKNENSDFVDMKEAQSDKMLDKKDATDDITSDRKNHDALLVTMKGVVQKEENGNSSDMKEKQPVKENDDKTEVKDISSTLTVKKIDDSFRNQVISVEDSHPGTKVDMRDSNYPDTICFEKLKDKILGEKKTKTESFHDNDFINKNIDVSPAKSTPIDESIPRKDGGKFATSKEIHTNNEMVEEVQGLQAWDGISATTKSAELKDAENHKNPEETIQHTQFKVAEKLGYVVVEEQKPEKALKNGKERKDMEKEPQVDIEEHAVDAKEIQGHLKESNLNTSQSEMQEETVKEKIHISESSMEEKLQSEQQMEPMLKEEKMHEQHVIDEADHETAKLVEIKEAKLSPQKKHGTVFSEVRSKFKHSISSVKKAITCSSSFNLN